MRVPLPGPFSVVRLTLRLSTGALKLAVATVEETAGILGMLPGEPRATGEGHARSATPFGTILDLTAEPGERQPPRPQGFEPRTRPPAPAWAAPPVPPPATPPTPPPARGPERAPGARGWQPDSRERQREGHAAEHPRDAGGPRGDGAEPQAQPRARGPEPTHVDEEVVLVAGFADSGAGNGAGAQVHVSEPWPGYDLMKAADVIDRFGAESVDAVSMALLYERGHRRRRTVVAAAERQLARRAGRA